MPKPIQRLLAAALLAALAAPGALAVEQVTVVGLFQDKAVVDIDGKRRMLETGEVSPEGVKLVSASSEEAVLEVDGEQARYPLGTRITTDYAAASADEATARIWRSPEGMYTVTGAINGYPVDFVVDTGATLIAMNRQQAKRLGIDYRVEGRAGLSETASGLVDTYILRLDRVRVGDIVLNDVPAAVLDSDHPRQVLLGMSFLNRLEIRRAGDLMELKKQY